MGKFHCDGNNYAAETGSAQNNLNGDHLQNGSLQGEAFHSAQFSWPKGRGTLLEELVFMSKWRVVHSG